MKNKSLLPGNLLKGAVVRAEYDIHPQADFAGNPLLEALPLRWNDEEVAGLLRFEIAHTEYMRQWPAVERIYAVQSLTDCFEPLPMHIQLAQALSDTLRQGLKNRNPLDPSYWIEVDENSRVVVESLQSSQNFDSRSYRRRPLRLAMSTLGDSGMGKSRSHEEVLLLYPQVIIHGNYPHDVYKQIAGFLQIVWLRVEMSANGSLKSLLLDILRAIEAALDFQQTNYLKSFSGTVDQMIGNIAHLAGLHGIGLIVIDEMQRVVGSKDQNKVMGFIEALINTSGVPICLIGTEDAYELLSGTFSTARRLTGTRGLIDWRRLDNDDSFDFFMDCLWEYQYTSVNTELDDELRRVFYDETQGIIDLIVKLYMMCQIHVIEQHSLDEDYPEIITPTIVTKVARNGFKHLQEALNKLRKGQEANIYAEQLRMIDVETEAWELVARLRREINQLDMLKKQRSEQVGASPAPKPAARKPRKEKPSRSSENEVILPGGVLEAFHHADDNKLSKYETFIQYGFIWTPPELGS